MQTKSEESRDLRAHLIVELLRAHASVGGQLSMAQMIDDAKKAEAYIRGNTADKPLPCDTD